MQRDCHWGKEMQWMMQRDCHGGKEMLTLEKHQTPNPAKNDDDMWPRPDTLKVMYDVLEVGAVR